MADNEKQSKVKRVVSVVFTVISAIIFVFVALLLINMIVCRSQNRPVNFFGYSFSVVQTNSMEDEIMTGDLIVFKQVEFSSLKVGDNIVFKADENFKDGAGNSLEGYTIVHKIIEITDDGLVTKGVHNLVKDGGFRTEDDIFGLCVSNSAGWGKVFTFLSRFGVLIIILIVAVPVIVSQTFKIVKLSKDNKEDNPDNNNNDLPGETTQNLNEPDKAIDGQSLDDEGRENKINTSE